MEPPEFVRVSSDGKTLELHGRPWRVAGTNCYYLLARRETLEAPAPMFWGRPEQAGGGRGGKPALR